MERRRQGKLNQGLVFYEADNNIDKDWSILGAKLLAFDPKSILATTIKNDMIYDTGSIKLFMTKTEPYRLT